MLKELMQNNANKAKQQLKNEIESQKAYIKLKEETFFNSLLTNPTNYSIREQATFLGTCRETLFYLQDALATLEMEFPTRNLHREFDREFELHGEMANEFNETYPGTEDDWMDLDEGGL
jgi:hypothetical protein